MSGHRPCPSERFATLDEARTELAQRRARAVTGGTPRTAVEAYACRRCGGAHLRRVRRLRWPAPEARPAELVIA